MDQQYITNAEFQKAYDHICLCWSYGRQAGRTFTLLGDSDRAPAMRELRIYGKNRLLELFRAWLKKQIGVKARTGRPAHLV